MLDTDEGWAKYNKHYWVRDYRGFLEFFFSQFFIEPHSTKQIEDCVGWGLETTPETLVDTRLAIVMGEEETRASVSASAVRSWSFRGLRTRSRGRHAESSSPRPQAAASSCSRGPVTDRTSATQ